MTRIITQNLLTFLLDYAFRESSFNLISAFKAIYIRQPWSDTGVFRKGLVICYNKLYNPFYSITNSFTWITQLNFSDCNLFPQFAQHVSLACDSTIRLLRLQFVPLIYTTRSLELQFVPSIFTQVVLFPHLKQYNPIYTRRVM